MATDTSFIGLILEASWVVQLVMPRAATARMAAVKMVFMANTPSLGLVSRGKSGLPPILILDDGETIARSRGIVGKNPDGRGNSWRWKYTGGEAIIWVRDTTGNSEFVRRWRDF